MEQQLTKTEAGYRAIVMDSSSSLKEFSMDRKKYHRRYVLREEIRDKTVLAIMMGNLVETLLLEPDLFDEKFYMSACVNPPTGLMLAFVEALYQEAKEATDEEGVVGATFQYMAEEAYKRSGFKTKIEGVIKKFGETDAVVYFEEICKVRTNNLTVVNTQDVTNAKKIVEELKNNPITKNLVTLHAGKRYTMLDQYQVEGYDYLGHKFKSMMDRVIIDHEERSIQVMDLKCTWSVENFYTEYYLLRRSYIQALLYFNACIHMRDTNPELEGYTVNYPMFLVCDSINYFSPLVYTLDQSDIEDAITGFKHNNKIYPGVKEIISNLKWAISNDIWNISKSAHDAGGTMNIKYGHK